MCSRTALRSVSFNGIIGTLVVPLAMTPRATRPSLNAPIAEEYRPIRPSPTLMIRNSFRNWDYPIRRQIFSGFRCARDA